MREKTIEQKLVSEVKKRGGIPHTFKEGKTLVALRFFETAKKSGTNAVRAIPLVHKQNPKRHHYGTNIPKEKMYYNDPDFL